MKGVISRIIACVLVLFSPLAALAEDLEGSQEHPMISRYPGQEIRWQEIQNHLEFHIPTGDVTGYRTITDWIDTAGLVTRTWYAYEGEDRTATEIYTNYLDALMAEDFQILRKGYSTNRRGVEPGSSNWLLVYLAKNPWTKPGEVGYLSAGTATSGGAGTIVASKERPTGKVYVVINVEQHRNDYVGTLVDIVEEQKVESGLVAVDAEAIGKGLTEKGKVVLDGIVFDFDKATLKTESKPALDAIANYLKANSQQHFYVVGHTDSKGSTEYNLSLSANRAKAVVDALVDRYAIAPKRLEAHGVGSLSPVFSNGSDAGREQNRRVELVEKL